MEYDFPAMLGMSLDDFSKSPFAVSLKDKPKPKLGAGKDRYYLSFLKEGMDVSASLDHRIETFFFFSEGLEKHQQFKGHLPEGIRFEDTPKTVRARLGKPTLTGGGDGQKSSFGPIPKWHRYDNKQFCLHIQYSPDEASVDRVTLMRADSAPKRQVTRKKTAVHLKSSSSQRTPKPGGRNARIPDSQRAKESSSTVTMKVHPRHVICVLGKWQDWSEVETVLRASPCEFKLDRDYSQLSPDPRMPRAFEASLDRARSSLRDRDLKNIRSHTAVAYILSPPLPANDAEKISGEALLLTAEILKRGGVAAKSESAGLAHGRTRWIELAKKYLANKDDDSPAAGEALYEAWVQRIIHDESSATYYSCGMHLLGHRDTEVADSLDPFSALSWIDLLGLHLIINKPTRPLKTGQEFGLSDGEDARVITRARCTRYAKDDFFFSPYGYYRLVAKQSKK